MYYIKKLVNLIRKKKYKKIIKYSLNFSIDMLKNIKKYLFKFLVIFVRVDSNKIVFCNFYGKGYGDNPKYITEYIIKEKENWKLVWIIDKKNINTPFPKEIKKVKYGTLRAMYELASAKIWIDNVRKDIYPFKKKNQYYIQTWHGGIALKKIEKDAENSLPPNYIKKAKKDSKMIDFMISNSEFCTNMYKRAFWYNGKIIEIGTPRNDVLLNKSIYDEIKKNVYEKLNIKKDTKIVLYAPTFRKDGGLEYYDLNFKLVIQALEKQTNESWICLLRLHPNISFKNLKLELDEKSVIDVSKYNDIYELMVSSNILITDYSSLMFEFSYMKKPVFLYANDVNEYIKDRGFYFDYLQLPYMVSKNNYELIENIKSFNYEEYENKLKLFINRIGLKEDGNASKNTVDIIKNIIKETNNEQK